jgi:adenylosuccinate synthase
MGRIADISSTAQSRPYSLSEVATARRPQLAYLSVSAIKYIRRVEELIRYSVALVSTSPERDKAIAVRDPFSS